MGERHHLDARTAETTSSSSLALTESRLQLLVDTGLLLAQERSLDAIVQGALDAGRHLSGAAFGVCFYTNTGDDGAIDQLYKTSGPHPSSPASFAARHSHQQLAGLFDGNGEGVVRSADLTAETHSDARLPFPGLSLDDPSVRSYLAAPVRGRGGEILGALFYGHPAVGVFTGEMEALVSTVASQAGVAIENARLASSLSTQIAISDAAQRLQQLTARRLRQALDAAALGTFTWDRESDLLDLDERAAELFHADPNVPVGRSFLRDQLVIPEDRELTLQHLHESLKSGGLYAAEYRVADTDGAIRWLSTSGLATRVGGEVTGMTGVVQDVSTRKVQEAALRESEKLAATGRLAATIAHEINNPLEAITNLIYLVKTDPELPPHLQQMMETADNELARVGQIAQQTLGFYRDTTHPVEIDLCDLLAKVIDLFARKLGYKRLQCTLDLEPDLRLFGFAGEMRQIFSNLLVNAIDASTSGTIHLRARRRNMGGSPGVVVLLADPGSGIPEHARKRLFSPFFTTKESVGTGLGLWVTRGMVEKHGGRIGYRSRTDHPTGTVFRVHLPQAFPSGIAMYSAPAATLIQ